MRFGFFGINFGACAQPATAIAVAKAAEGAGFDSLWTGEHVVLPDPQVPPSPVPPLVPMLDPAVALAALSQHTSRVKLGTGIIILPQRNPLVLAKELASLDVVSGGRLIFGVGVGYLEAEFRALGVPFEDKGARTMDSLRAMQAIWTQAKPAYAGRFTSFSGIDAHPRPVQKPHPPIVFGGHTAPAFRRAVEIAAGWYGFALDVEAAARCSEGLRVAASRHERDPGQAALEISVTPPAGLPDIDTVKRYEDLGVDRLILMPAATRARTCWLSWTLPRTPSSRDSEDAGPRMRPSPDHRSSARGAGTRRVPRRRRPLPCGVFLAVASRAAQAFASSSSTTRASPRGQGPKPASALMWPASSRITRRLPHAAAYSRLRSGDA